MARALLDGTADGPLCTLLVCLGSLIFGAGVLKTTGWFTHDAPFAGALQTKYGFTCTLKIKKRYDWGVPSEHKANLKIHIPGLLDYDIAQPEIARLHTV